MFESLVKNLGHYETVLEPDRNEADWWAGAPSVTRDDSGVCYLAARMRHAESPKGRRGYETRILRSEDGKQFETIHRITREDAGVPGFERPALIRDPGTGRFKLYTCAGLENGWTILKFDDAGDPADFDAATIRPVLAAEPGSNEFIRVQGYKDPVLHHDGAQWHMFVIGCDRVERIHHFTSRDGEAWRAAAFPVLENTGWHNCYTRPASVLPMAAGCLFVYEGSTLGWHDPNYNIATGLAYTPDLETFYDLTPDAPLLKSTTPGEYHTWRYSHWMHDGDSIRVYFEAARPNNTNEIRLACVPAFTG
jgi:hypothetical protein